MSPGSDLLDMSSTASYSEAFKFPKLGGSNYPTWSVHMQSALRSRMLWLVVNGTDTKPPKPEEENMNASDCETARRGWMQRMQKDEAAMGSILAACEDSQHAFILQCVSSKGMWAELRMVHVENQTKVNVHYHFEELFTRRYVDDTSMTDHIAAMLDIKHRITQAVGNTF
jgi:hypothetical protein